MLTSRNPTLDYPALVPHPCPAPDRDARLIPPFSCLSRYALFTAPIEDEEKDEDEPEEEEDHLDQEEEEEDEDDYDDEEDDDADEVDEVDEEEDEEDDDEEEEDDEDPDSGTFFLQHSRSRPRNPTIQ